MADDDTNRTLTLPDGRQLGYARYGCAEGYPVVYFHGLPGSRYECRLLQDAAGALGVRILAPERPGYGLSTRQPGRRLSQWPQDITALADSLDIETFSVVGVSAGGPCALACAHALPRRVAGVAVVCGLGPLNQAPLRRSMSWTARFAFYLAEAAPGALRALYGLPLNALARLTPAAALRAFALSLGGADRKVLLQPKVLKLLSANLQEAFRQGAHGALQDVAIYRHPWGFEAKDIAVPVHFWHGNADRIVPPLHSQYLHDRLPGSRLSLVPGEGHFSLPVRHATAILETLLAEAGSAAPSPAAGSAPHLSPFSAPPR
ncbi:MAG: alpha/beta hydrolase [Thiogranum sp.]|nr:alpha/beta hydrolase [Thiogranum sp.]